MKNFLYKLYLKYCKPTNRFARVGFNFDEWDDESKGAFYRECNTLRNENTIHTLCKMLISEIEHESLYLSNRKPFTTTESALYDEQIRGIEKIMTKIEFLADQADDLEDQDKTYMHRPI